MAGINLKHLGRKSEKPVKELEVIPWPKAKREESFAVRIECSEFTSLCPVTSQPDFGSLIITYRPDSCIVETKSLKLFLWSYRRRKAFNETLVREIGRRFFEAVKPLHLLVEGHFNARGGIKVNPVYERSKTK